MPLKLKWGILGTGNIARQFAQAMPGAARGELTAVGSRSLASAESFAREFAVPAAYGSYDALLADDSVTAVYNSLPNTLHHEWTIKALRAGKHVLCEKPIAVTRDQAQEMFDVARATGRTLVEAFMYRSHPIALATRKLIDDGSIGRLRLIRTSFCYNTSKVDGNIRFDAALAGGALMDIGCYCINFARWVAGAEPTRATVSGTINDRGVDELAAGLLAFPGGVISTFSIGMRTQADNTASICGDGGYIEIPVPWKPPVQQAQLVLGRSTPPRMDSGGKLAPARPPRETLSLDAPKPLYALEADDFAQTVLDGAPPVITPEDSIGNMAVLDTLRKELGLAY